MNGAGRGECAFCAMVEGRSAASIVFEDKLTMAFINLRQFRPGHAIVIPRQHFGDARELDEASGAALMSTLSLVTRAIAAAFPHEGLSLWHSIGKAAFQEVPHLHFHIHPRFKEDGVFRVYPEAPATSDKQTRDDYAAPLRQYIPAGEPLKSGSGL
jgi:histidine triad (HIT) family protein